jgi:hypothetical protein
VPEIPGTPNNVSIGESRSFHIFYTAERVRR